MEVPAVVTPTAAVPGVWQATLPCPNCGARNVIGYMLTDEEGRHMHSRYVCRHWPSGATRACGWGGWSVPGWETADE